MTNRSFLSSQRSSFTPANLADLFKHETTDKEELETGNIRPSDSSNNSIPLSDIGSVIKGKIVNELNFHDFYSPFPKRSHYNYLWSMHRITW